MTIPHHSYIEESDYEILAMTFILAIWHFYEQFLLDDDEPSNDDPSIFWGATKKKRWDGSKLESMNSEYVSWPRGLTTHW